MRVERIALMSFIHDDIRAVRDRPILQPMSDSLASELERKGLIRVRLLPRRVDRELVPAAVAEIVPGKVAAVGMETPSSSLPAAQVSETKHTQTLHLPKRGKGKRRRGGM